MSLRALFLSLPQNSGSQGTLTGPPTNMTLLSALNAFTLSNFTAVQSGRELTGVSGGGRSSTFAPPAVFRSLTPENFAGLSELLQNVYAEAITDLAAFAAAAIPPTTPPTDDGGSGTQAIFNQMMNAQELDDVNVTQKDYTSLLIPYR